MGKSTRISISQENKEALDLIRDTLGVSSMNNVVSYLRALKGAKLNKGLGLVELRIIEKLHSPNSGIIDVGMLRKEIYRDRDGKILSVSYKAAQQAIEVYKKEIETHNKKFK